MSILWNFEFFIKLLIKKSKKFLHSPNGQILNLNYEIDFIDSPQLFSI